MCAVSMIMDHYGEKWGGLFPQQQPWIVPLNPLAPQFPPANLQPPLPTISAEEVAEFRRLLERAREYDKRNNEPECEMAEKRETIQKLAKLLGVDVSFL